MKKGTMLRVTIVAIGVLLCAGSSWAGWLPGVNDNPITIPTAPLSDKANIKLPATFVLNAGEVILTPAAIQGIVADQLMSQVWADAAIKRVLGTNPTDAANIQKLLVALAAKNAGGSTITQAEFDSFVKEIGATPGQVKTASDSTNYAIFRKVGENIINQLIAAGTFGAITGLTAEGIKTIEDYVL